MTLRMVAAGFLLALALDTVLIAVVWQLTG
jgi:hypothetical protein